MNTRFAGRHSIRHWIAPVVLVMVGGAFAQGQDVLDDPLTGGTGDATATDDAGGLDNLGESGVSGEAGEAGEAGAEEMTLEQRQAQIREKFATAASLMAGSQWAEAIAVFNEILPLAPYSQSVAPNAHLGMGECFFNLKSYEQAVAQFSRATSAQGAGSVAGLVERALLLRGASYMELTRYREAMEDLGSVVQMNPSNPDAYFNLGKASLRLTVTSSMGGLDQGAQSQLLQGVQSLEQAITLKPDYGQAYLERGRILSRLSEMDFAIEDLQKAVEILGAESEASADLGVALNRRARDKASLPNVNADEVKADLQSSIASMSNYLKSVELGKKSVPWETRDPIRVDPEEIMLARVEAKIALGDEMTGPEQSSLYRDALADCDKLLALQLPDLDEARAHYNRGVALRMLNELRPAIEAFSRAVERWPAQFGAYSEAHLRRGICLYHTGEDRAALQDFEAAAVLPNNPYDYEPRAMFWAGLAAVKLGDFDGAIRSYTRAINSAPTYAPPYLNRGLAYLQTGRYERALSDFNTIMRLDPNHPTVQRYRELAMANIR